MKVAGIIAEYDPLHTGHMHLMQEVRTRLGTDSGIICVMSGNFVQRGDFAVVRKQARAEAAVRSGADLVLELPLSWATAGAERFADGGIQTLLATGIVTHLAFGSECGDAAALQDVAKTLEEESFGALLRAELLKGDSFAAARQRAVERMLGAERAEVLASPNNTLGVEYCKSLLRRGGGIEVMTIPRQGAAYHEKEETAGHPSATMLRTLLQQREEARALDGMVPAMAELYRKEVESGRAPVFSEVCERAVLARLRSMTEADFAALDSGGEGMYHRLYQASREATTWEGVLQQAKTRRYAYARLRRMTLWGYLGLTEAELPQEVPYLRVLAVNETGRRLLRRMRETALLPVLIKSADVRQLSREAQTVFETESRATDLYTLAYPRLEAAVCGEEWRTGPVIV